MSLITLRYQVAVFGNYDDITPSLENIRFFLTDFSDKNFIPSQVKEAAYNVENGGIRNVGISRLNLSTADETWDIRFDAERIDFIFTNLDINVTVVPTLDDFVIQVNDFLSKISTRFIKKHKRIGLVAHQVSQSEAPKLLLESFVNPAPFFRDKQVAEWSNRMAARMNIAEPLAETINVTNETMWVSRPLLINSKQVVFSGIQNRTDVNTFAENPVYRITSDNALPFLQAFVGILNKVKQEITQSIQS